MPDDSSPIKVVLYSHDSQGLGHVRRNLAIAHHLATALPVLTGRPVSELWLARLQRGGIAVLLAMMSIALFNDVARLLGLH